MKRLNYNRKRPQSTGLCVSGTMRRAHALLRVSAIVAHELEPEEGSTGVTPAALLVPSELCVVVSHLSVPSSVRVKRIRTDCLSRGSLFCRQVISEKWSTAQSKQQDVTVRPKIKLYKVVLV